MKLEFVHKMTFFRRGTIYRAPTIAVIISGLFLVLAACSQAGDPAAAMMKYLEARVAADADAIRGLSCAAWEGQAVMQADSFRAMNAELQDVTCAKSGEDGNAALVTCDGLIVTSYQGETREWELGTYRMTQEDGEWKMCGEAP
jgi:hypothetical protein